MALESRTFLEGLDLLIDCETTDYLLRSELAEKFHEIRVENGRLLFRLPADRKEYDEHLKMRAHAESRLQDYQKTGHPQIRAAQERLKSDSRQ